MNLRARSYRAPLPTSGKEKRTAKMNSFHLFEFMDQSWVPRSLRATLREILECGNSVPFRSYYQWVAHEVTEFATANRIENIVELGAGTAPITKLLAKEPRLNGVRLTVCDDNPDVSAYEILKKNHPGNVHAVYEPIDFSRPKSWPPGTLLMLSATLHHLPSDVRSRVLSGLVESTDCVMVFEPLRRTVVSMLFVLCAIVPALLVPLRFLGRPGRLRRFVWCWLLPVAPLMFCWDGVVSCLRMWTAEDWESHLRISGVKPANRTVGQTTFCQMVTLDCAPRGCDTDRSPSLQPEYGLHG